MQTKYYRAPPDELWQGDVLELGPAIFVRAFHQEVLRSRTISGGRQVYDRHRTDEAPPDGGFNFPEDVAARGNRTFAILLNHDCDFDKVGEHPKQLALVKGFDPLGSPEIVEGRQVRAFYLPENDEPEFAPAFADFRQITTVRDEVVQSATRVLSMTDELRLAFRAAISRYFARGEERR